MLKYNLIGNSIPLECYKSVTMTSMENAEKFLSQEQLCKLADQLNPVCEKHCPQSLKCIHGVMVDCPLEIFIEHLKRHTRSEQVRKASLEIPSDPGSIYIDQLKKDLAKPECNRIKAKLRKISMITERLTATGYSSRLEHGLGEIRNLLEELHEFDTMIRNVDSMVLRGYFYTCLDRLTDKCRSYEEDLRWAMAERESQPYLCIGEE